MRAMTLCIACLPLCLVACQKDDCKDLNADECAKVGVTFRDAKPPDAIRASAIFERACSAGAARGCNYLGQDFEAAVGRPHDDDAAKVAYKRACELAPSILRGKKACMPQTVGLVYITDGKEPKSEEEGKKATAEAERGCDEGTAKACFTLGVILNHGVGVKWDPKRAVGLFSRACDQDNAMACSNLGFMTESGTWVPDDAQKTKALFEKACRLFKQANADVGASCAKAEMLGATAN